MIEVRIRRADLTDRPVVQAFHRALYLDHRASVMPEGMERLFAYRSFQTVLAEDVAAMLRDPSVVVLLALAERDLGEEAIGYISGTIESDDRRVIRRKGVVGDWYVAEELRGSGVGRRLFETLESIFAEAGCGLVEVATWPFNEGTRKALGKLGYEEIQITYRKELGD
jgi:GNAT superfamily N-acetyltransferase